MSSRAAVLGVCFGLTMGCSLARATLANGTDDDDARTMDAGGSEHDGAAADAFVGTADAAADDAAILENDAAADDAAVVVDAATVDAAPDLPDAFVPPLRSCGELYGSEASYELCREGADDCEIYVRLSGASCASVCSAHGGTCVTAYGNGAAGSNCGRIGDGDACDSTHTDEICVCTRVP
jgi:hypothetical protein